MRPKAHCVVFLLFFIQSQWLVLSELYKITLRAVEICTDPDPPYEKNRTIDVNVIPYNNSGGFYFRGNATIKQNLRGYYWKLKTGVLRSGVIKYTNRFNKLGCKSVIPRILLTTAKIKYNEKTCEVSKGNYTFSKMDFTKLDPRAYYYPIKELGESIVYFSYYGTSGTAYCLMSRYVVKTN